ncbi:eukaryotic initiation factor 4F subunit p150 [Monosporozyma servazzii]
MTEGNSQPAATPPATPKSSTSSNPAEVLTSINNSDNSNYVPGQQGNNKNKNYNNGQKQPYQKNYSNNYSKINPNGTGYSRYNKNRSNNYNNSGNTSGSNSKNGSFSNTNRYNNGSRFNNSQYYNNMTEEITTQQQPNMGWPGYYVPQMYYIPQQMATAAAMASASGMSMDMATNNMSPPMTSPQHGMATLNSTVPLIVSQSPPIASPNNMSGQNSSNNTASNLASPILSHITPVLSPPKMKIEITTKTGEKLDLSQIHKSPSPNSNKNSSLPSNAQKTNTVPLSTVSEKESTKASIAAATDSVPKKAEETEAEKNKKAFLEQVRLRKLAMDKKKQLESGVKIETKSNESEIENETTQTTVQEVKTEGETKPEAKETPEVHESTPLPENAKDEEEDVTEEKDENHVMTFAEKLKLKQHAHDNETVEPTTHENPSIETNTAQPESQTTATVEETKPTETGEAEVKDDVTEEKLPIEDDDLVEMTTFIKRLSQASPIEDIYKFKYPSELESPDEKYKKPNVKYTYGPTFLLQFKDKVRCKPDEEWVKTTQSKIVILPSMNKQKGKVNFAGGPDGGRAGSLRNLDNMSNSRGNSKRQSSKRFDERKSNRSSYTPRRERMENQSRRDTHRSSNNYHHDKPEPPKEDVAPFVPTANRWVPKSKAKKTEKKMAPDGVTELLEQDEVQRKMKSLLNKLTLEKFETISSDIINIANQSQWETDGATLKNVIEQIFLKACDEPYWSSMYAQLCGKIVKDMNPEIRDENNEGKTGPKLVLHYLVARCHTEFEKGWSDKLPTNPDGTPLEPEMMSDEYYVLATAKRRGLGLVRLIGFLYRLNLLTGKMMFECFRRLMKDLTENATEETLESLVELLTTVGGQFEKDSFSTGKGTLDGSILFDKLFQLLQGIIDEGKISNRIKFKLIDVRELREDKHWNSEKSNQGPKTIQQIHDEEEKARQDKAANSRAPSRRNNNNNSNSYNRGERNSNYRKDMSRDHYSNNNNNSHGFNNRPSQYSNNSTQRYNSRNSIKEEKAAPAHPINRFDALLHTHGDD